MKTGLPLVLSVTSGKGGVGKTNISANLACCLAAAGKRVLLLDADLGLANIDVILGLTPIHNLFHLFHEGATLQDIIMDTPYGFQILPAASGVHEMLSLTPGQKLSLLEAMEDLDEDVDYLIVDTGAGINDNVLYFNMAAQERMVILTPEPTSLTDVYALIKIMVQNHGIHHFRIVVNMAADLPAAKEIFMRLYKACDHFLKGVVLDFAGMIPRDPAMRASVIQQRPLCVDAPDSPAAAAIASIAQTIQTWNVPETLDGNIKFFWKRLLFQQ